LIAILIKILSPGPVILKQERIDHLGKRFRCLKFRTMAKITMDALYSHYAAYIKPGDSVVLESGSSSLGWCRQ